MSMPKFPELPDLNMECSLAQVISSIAMEELALSHIINAEGEKIQYVLGTLHDRPCLRPSVEDILLVNDSVKDMLSTVSMNQMFLFAKLSAAIDAHKKANPCCKPKPCNNNCNGNSGGGCNGNDNCNNCDNCCDCCDENSNITDFEIGNGRVIDGEELDDIANWVEIATYGNYSLILRTHYLNIYYGNAPAGDPSYQFTPFSYASNAYSSSIVRQRLNNWFTGNNVTGNADALPLGSVLRSHTVRHTALSDIGSGPVAAGLKNGFSTPTDVYDTNGLDVAFALSFGEAVNFVSKSYLLNVGEIQSSSLQAKNNFDQIVIPATSTEYSRMWLRSPGTNSDTVSSMLADGHVFQSHYDPKYSEYGLVYPALWVDTSLVDEFAITTV